MTENTGDAAGREFHAIAELFPLMRGEAFEELVADIRRNGLREPILVAAEGRILDGRNRYRACLQAGVEPRFVPWQGEGSLEELTLSLNLRRRHLDDESQRAMVAARLAKLMKPEATRRKGWRRDDVANLPYHQFGTSRGKAAVLVNVSARLISSAIKVLQSGSEELIAAVESGGLAVSAASVLAALPQEEQAQAVAGGPKQATRKAWEIRTGLPRTLRSVGYREARGARQLRLRRLGVSLVGCRRARGGDRSPEGAGL